MKNRVKIIDWIIEVLMWFISVLVLYPLLMVLLTSFKSQGEANRMSLSLPKEWLIKNYMEVIVRGKVIPSLWNSLFISILSVILIISLSSSLSFVIARRQTKPTKYAYTFLTFGIIAPFAALPTIELFKIMGLYGTRISLVLAYGAMYMPFSTMLITSFIKGIPRELDEAAIVDGTQGGGLFIRIILPLLKPVLATATVLNFMWVWNDFQYPMYLLNSSSKWTLPLSVYNFYGQYERSWNLVSADIILICIPIVLIYMFAQRYIIEGMTAGAVKG